MPLLQAEEVSVQFGGIHALQDVNLSCEPGEITGLIGPNGAGKTTMFNVICGLQETTRGRLRFDGTDVGRLRPHERARLGIARTFQRLEIFGSLTVTDNILTAAETRKRWAGDEADPRRVTARILDLVGLRGVADARADAMPTGLARLVELGRALATKPRLMLLDEPSSGLGHGESEAFADLLLSLAAGGLAILLVEHDVDLVMRVCARIHVLDFGRMIAVGTPAEVQANGAVQAAYLGATAGVGA